MPRTQNLTHSVPRFRLEPLVQMKRARSLFILTSLFAFTQIAALAQAFFITKLTLPQAIRQGQPLVLSVETSSNDFVIYQWQKDGKDIPRATGSSFRVDAASLTDSGNYQVKVFSLQETITSDPIAVLVYPNTVPKETVLFRVVQREVGTVILDPQGIDVGGNYYGYPPGTRVDVSLLAPEGSKVDSFSLAYCPLPLDCLTAGTEFFNATLIADGQLPGPDGTTKVSLLTNWSHTATVSTNMEVRATFRQLPPVIVEEPKDVKATTGSDATLSVKVQGGGPLEYQWFGEGKIPWATNSTLVLTNPTKTALYSVSVKNRGGIVASKQAEVRVLYPAANDNFLNADRLEAYLAIRRSQNFDGSLELGEPDHGGNSRSSAWYLWVSPIDGEVTLSAGVGAIIKLYTGNAVTNLVPVAGKENLIQGFLKQTFQVQRGVNYYIATDIINETGGGGQFTFTLTVDTLNMIYVRTEENINPVIYINGPPDTSFILEAATNLTDWTEVSNGMLSFQGLSYYIPARHLAPYKFFRARMK